jgi:hypothetical protein
VTAGSDYHGANKSIIRLGETNMEMIDEVPEGLTRFLEQVL